MDWIGTSLGGLVGMVLAGQEGSPIRRLVVNDIGPHLPWSALWRIGNAVRAAPRDFPSLAAAEAYCRTTLAPFGDLGDAEWRHLTVHGVERREDGRCHQLYDPGIVRTASPLLLRLTRPLLWLAFKRLARRRPTLVVRGALSDVLEPDLVARMSKAAPTLRVVEIPGVGHAPDLSEPESRAAIEALLSAAA